MMRSSPQARKASAREATIPAPIGGWNARDPIQAIPPTDAVTLDNFIPGTGGVALRTGYTAHVTGIVDPVESLMEYAASSGADALFAAAGTKVYNVTTAGTAGPAVLSGLTNARFQHTMFETPGGHFLVICNGQDAVRNWNGSAWSTPSITGVTSAGLVQVNAHAKRLWFVEKNTLNAWYLPTSSIAGAASQFPLGAVAKKGGSLLAMASWTRDGGAGPDDTAVFLTTKGEAIIYSGTDPASADSWQLIGVFNIPEPVGRRCWVKAGADVGVITSQGVVPLSTILAIDQSGQGRSAVTDKIKGAFASAYKGFGGLFGWQILEYPKGELLLVNVPQAGGTTSHQYVMNRATGAWCRFTGLNALALSLLSGELYFGTNGGTIHRLHANHDDNGVPVSGIVLPAFGDFGTPGAKQFKMAKPHFTAVAGTEPPVSVRVDYDRSPATVFSSAVPDAGSPWDTSPWDTSSWGPVPESLADWQSLEGIGRVGSVMIAVSSLNPLTLHHTDVIYEAGGAL
jgi:hypothetical protein